MYLAYMDDSGTQRRESAFQVLSAVIVKDDLFSNVEILSAASVEMWIPQERLDGFTVKFEEFKAHELYNGSGPFEGMEQPIRFEMIHALLQVIKDQELKVIYGAVNKELFLEHDYGSANPIDVCFRICARGVNGWLADHAQGELGLLIADDSDRDKTELAKSFRQLRRPIRAGRWALPTLEHLHDDMYFGDSKYSIGIQLADLCSFFIAKHLLKHPPEAQPFYNVIAPQIVHSQVEPEENRAKVSA